MAKADKALKKDLTPDEFRRFRDYIHQHSGIYLEDSKLDSLRISIVSRATRHEFAEFDEYFELISMDEDEFKELLNLVTINETSFFRFPAQFDALREKVIPEIVQERAPGNQMLRVWSAGCSTGEEPYSVAMTVIDSGIEGLGWSAHVMGTDVSTQALEIARAGVYRRKALANVPPAVVKRHFEEAEGGMRVNSHARRMVDFGFHNLIKEPYPLSLMGFWDVIFCRNVTIYFKLESVRRVIKNFHNSLNEGGYLFVGHSETLSGISDDFEAVETGGVFLYRKPAVRRAQPISTILGRIDRATDRARRKRREAAAAAEHPASEPEDAAPAETVEVSEAASVGEILGVARDLIERGRHAEGRAFVDRALEMDGNSLDAHLLAAYSCADSGEYEAALVEATKALAINPLLAGARYVVGVIHLRQNDLVRATSELKKTVYIDPDFVLAHLNLGNILRGQGNWAAACRAYENALLSLERNPDGAWTGFMGGFTADLLAKTCERSLIECRKAMGVA